MDFVRSRGTRPSRINVLEDRRNRDPVAATTAKHAASLVPIQNIFMKYSYRSGRRDRAGRRA